MSILMPLLEEGRIYRRLEVESYIGKQENTSDFDVMAPHFPRNLDTWEHDGRGWRDREEIVLQYCVLSMSDLKPQIRELEESFWQNNDHRSQIEKIIELLLGGSSVYPVFMQQNDPRKRIIEGMHRAVALMQMESHGVPVFLTGYRNWFTPDKVFDGFDKEDDILSIPYRDVIKFFRHATCVDQKGRELAVLGGDRLSLCDNAFVAKYKGKIIGVATFAIAKGQPILSTVYVLKQFRRKGVAYRLCEAALQRFQDADVPSVFCDVCSFGMDETLNRLGQNRPDLGGLLRKRIGYQLGEDLECE